MSEKLVISVDASTTSPDLMKVQDVFAHVLELFDLASKSESDPEHTVIWRLVNVSMNSPLTVTAEAVSAKPNVNVDVIAKAQKQEFARNLNSLRKGIIPKVWAGESARKARSFLARNRNGIGVTSIHTDLDDPDLSDIKITHEDADFADAVMHESVAGLLQKPTKTQIGSVDGNLIEVGTHYGKPAILIRERKTGSEIWCIVPDEFRPQIADKATLNDVWSGRRVVVRGIIYFDRERKISKVEASHIRRIDGLDVPLENILDKSFTDDMPATEYLEKFREGSID